MKYLLVRYTTTISWDIYTIIFKSKQKILNEIWHTHIAYRSDIILLLMGILDSLSCAFCWLYWRGCCYCCYCKRFVMRFCRVIRFQEIHILFSNSLSVSLCRVSIADWLWVCVCVRLKIKEIHFTHLSRVCCVTFLYHHSHRAPYQNAYFYFVVLPEKIFLLNLLCHYILRKKDSLSWAIFRTALWRAAQCGTHTHFQHLMNKWEYFFLMFWWCLNCVHACRNPRSTSRKPSH